MSTHYIKLGNHLMKYELTPLRGPRSGGYGMKAKAREEAAEAAKQRRQDAALGLDDDDWIIGETQVTEWKSLHDYNLNDEVSGLLLTEAQRLEAERYDTLLRKRRKEIEETERRERADYIRNYLRELGCVVLRTPTTAEQLARDIKESYVTTVWYLLKEGKAL